MVIMYNKVKASVTKMTLRVALLVLAARFQLIKADLYDFGPGTDDVKIEYDSWMIGSHKINLLTWIPLFGGGITNHMWVNSFGSISLNQTSTDDIQKTFYNVILTPFYSASQEGSNGAVYQRQTVTYGPLFEAVARDVTAFERQLEERYNPSYVFLITWSNVASPDDSSKTNTFQLALTTDGKRTYVLFAYDPLNWSSASGSYAMAGIHAVKSEMEYCSAFLEGSGTANIFELAMSSNIIGSLGIHVVDITDPLHCTSLFATQCGAFPPQGRWIYRPRFELVDDVDLETNFYIDLVCKPGFVVSRGVISQKINCKYESDYYDYEWDQEMPMCIDLNTTRQFITSIEISTNNNITCSDDDEAFKEMMDKAISKLLESIEVTNAITAIDKIRNSTTNTTVQNNATNSVCIVEFTTYVSTFTNKKLTDDKFHDKLVEEINKDKEIDLINFDEKTVTVTDMTSSCLQGCLCRNLKDPILCRKGQFKPELLPDACCGECGGRMIPYASSIKACCGNRHLYDPMIKVCCNGKIRKGHECKI